MNKFYFTFGFGHQQKSRSLANCYTIIEGENEAEAVKQMYARRGNRWSFVYYSAERAGVKKFNLEFIPFDQITL